MAYYCEACEYRCTKSSHFTQHMQTAKHHHKATLHEACKCKVCNVVLSNRSNYKKHLSTKRHRDKLTAQNLVQVNQAKQDPELLNRVIEQMSKQNDFLREQNTLLQTTVQAMVEKVGVSNSYNNNKTFNLQVFLNEQCKDAINWSDFVQTINVSIEEFNDDDPEDITDKVTNTICKELERLGVNKRPIHCTDIKRHRACVKEKDVWTKQENLDILKKGVVAVSDKFKKMLQQWVDQHPGWYNDELLTDQYVQMIRIYMHQPEEDKCVKALLKNSVII